MSNYLSKYKGTYRLKVDYDEETGDFYKDDKGVNLDVDMYIDCKKGRIFHYGGNILTAYVEPCDNSYVTNETEDYYLGNYDKNQKVKRRPDDDYVFDPLEEKVNKRLYMEDGVTEYPYKSVKVLKTYIQRFNTIIKEHSDVIIENSVVSSDIGGSFMFKAKDVDVIAKAMGVYKSGAKSSPFSIKYLPKESYTIPKKDLDKMKLATSKFDKTQLHYITKAYRDFSKSKGLNYAGFKKEYRLAPKEVFHKLGCFDELIDYINKIEV